MPLNLPVLKLLETKTIILASASPRRREILESIVRQERAQPYLNLYLLSKKAKSQKPWLKSVSLRA